MLMSFKTCRGSMLTPSVRRRRSALPPARGAAGPERAIPAALGANLVQAGELAEAASARQRVCRQSAGRRIARMAGRGPGAPGSPDAAVATLREGLRLTPDAPVLHRALGSVLERADHPREAGSAYRSTSVLARTRGCRCDCGPAQDLGRGRETVRTAGCFDGLCSWPWDRAARRLAGDAGRGLGAGRRRRGPAQKAKSVKKFTDEDLKKLGGKPGAKPLPPRRRSRHP